MADAAQDGPGLRTTRGRQLGGHDAGAPEAGTGPERPEDVRHGLRGGYPPGGQAARALPVTPPIMMVAMSSKARSHARRASSVNSSPSRSANTSRRTSDTSA